MTKRKILVVGDALIDRHWYCTPKGVSPEAPILSWEVDSIVDQPGGAANVTANLCAFRENYKSITDIKLVSVVSRDFLNCIPENFPRDGLLYQKRLQTIKNRIIFKTPHQQIVRFDQDNNKVFNSETEEQLIEKILSEEYDVGVISDYGHGGINRKIIAAARDVCNTILCDPKGTNVQKYIGLVDILTPNLKEFEDLAPNFRERGSIHSLINLADTIKGKRKEGVGIILKRGKEGCNLYHHEKGIHDYEPYRNNREVIDPTGAGDTFIATLAFELAYRIELKTAVKLANRFAGISVTHPNCWIPTEEECLKRRSE